MFSSTQIDNIAILEAVCPAHGQRGVLRYLCYDTLQYRGRLFIQRISSTQLRLDR